MTRWKEAAEKYADPLSSDWDTMPYSPHWLNKIEDAFQAGAAHGYEVGRAVAIACQRGKPPVDEALDSAQTPPPPATTSQERK